MKNKRIVHVVGTGTIGEPLIGLLAIFRKELGIEEVTFHKRTPLLTDRSKVLALQKRGARLAVDQEAWKKFASMGMAPSYEALEAIDRAAVVIDCTPAGNDNKESLYNRYGQNAHGLFGRILSQTVVPVQSVAVKDKREVVGFSFTPQDGNSLLSSIAAAEWFLYPENYNERLQCIEGHIFQEI